MLAPCTSCGNYLHASDINDAYANGVCFGCRSRAEHQRAEAKTCTKCGGQANHLYATDFSPYVGVYCASCWLKWTRAFFEPQLASQAPRHAHLLAEYAGERLEWPCSAEELKRVWRSAARRTHPDTGGSSETFRAAKASYDVLVEVVR